MKSFALGFLLLSTPAFAQFLYLKSCEFCSEPQFERLIQAQDTVNEVVDGLCFQNKLKAMPLIQTGSRSSEEVVQHILSSQVELDIVLYYSLKRVYGYTLPNVPKVWLNKRYRLSKCQMGSLLAHETSHQIGYDHDQNRTDRRPFSVPYSINRAFEACCQE